MYVCICIYIYICISLSLSLSLYIYIYICKGLCSSGPRKPCWQKPCWQIYAHGPHGYVGASARVAPLRNYSYSPSGTFKFREHCKFQNPL